MPETLEDTGLPQVFLAELALKIAFYFVEFTPKKLSDSSKLAPSLVIELLEYLQSEKWVEARGSYSYLPTTVKYILTELGTKRATDLLAHNGYAGPAPVPFENYVELIWNQTIQSTVADETIVAKGFKDLVLPGDLFSQLGPAINSGRSIFLYGPPGTGKTSIGKDIAKLFKDDVFIPYSVYAHGQIVQIFDAISHELSPDQPESWDKRWNFCRRPSVVVGGEMTLDMLELALNPMTNIYEAPLQLKANNGVLIIDDFGRQRISVRDLLNRWIVPLETGQEYLSLSSCQKITVPFDVLIIFCTNIAPKDLVDEAFLRRIRHKIKIGWITPEDFFEILRRNCEKNFIDYDQTVAEYLVDAYYTKPGRPIAAVHARDIIYHIVDLARYRKTKATLTKEALHIACSTYFVEDY
jgi:predicted ATPase with chaperone activity